MHVGLGKYPSMNKVRLVGLARGLLLLASKISDDISHRLEDFCWAALPVWEIVMSTID